MKRFENAQVGDKVYCRINGFGTISQIDKNRLYSVVVDLPNDDYTIDGRLYENDAEPTLFYSDGINNYLTERPETKTEINWTEWEGKEIEVLHEYFGTWEKRKLIKYLPAKENKFLCENGQDSELYTAFDKARLIEEKEPEIDWNSIEEGTEIEVYSSKDDIWLPKIFYAYATGKKFNIITKRTEWLDLQCWEKARLING